jgi:hypothetical protein
MGDRDFEAINRLAMEQISKLEKGETSELVPQVGTTASRGSVWRNDYSRSSWRPSSYQEEARVPLFGSSTPRSFLTSRDSSSGGHYNPDAFYRRTLNAVYRQESTDKEEEKEMVVTTITRDPGSLRIGGLLFDEEETTKEYVVKTEDGEQVKYEVKPRQMVIPRISADAKNQMMAIILSGFTRMASTMVVNWAKERKVPYELL